MVTFKESFVDDSNTNKVLINHRTNVVCKLGMFNKFIYSYSYSKSIYILSKTENPYLFNFKLFQV